MIPTIQLGGLGRFRASGGTTEDPVYWVMLTSDYTLTNTTAEQKYFNTTANGALTLGVGIYQFEWWLYMTGLVSNSNSLTMDVLGAGTAVTDRWGAYVFGRRNATPLTEGISTSGSATVGSQTATPAFTPAGTGARGRLSGAFRVTTSGTIIPSITMQIASASVAKAGSYFLVTYLNTATDAASSGWS